MAATSQCVEHFMRHMRSPLQPQSPPPFLGAGAGAGEGDGDAPPLLPPPVGRAAPGPGCHAPAVGAFLGPVAAIDAEGAGVDDGSGVGAVATVAEGSTVAVGGGSAIT